MLNGTVHSGCTHPTQTTTRLVIVLLSRIQKIGSGDNNFVKWKGTFWSDLPPPLSDQTGQVDHLQSWSQIFRSDRTELVRAV